MVSPQAYELSLAALGVTRRGYDTLVPTRQRSAFQQAARGVCLQFLEANGLSTLELLYRKRATGFTSPRSQGVWCSFGAVSYTHLTLPTKA